mmetsp:Transcript_77894/g.140551  ORF Transcript_77894/g.140551 Transcript_77894/m.140551 type:complete len:213 (+) Transcript_77894:119-757(+)
MRASSWPWAALKTSAFTPRASSRRMAHRFSLAGLITLKVMTRKHGPMPSNLRMEGGTAAFWVPCKRFDAEHIPLMPQFRICGLCQTVLVSPRFVSCSSRKSIPAAILHHSGSTSAAPSLRTTPFSSSTSSAATTSRAASAAIKIGRELENRCLMRATSRKLGCGRLAVGASKRKLVPSPIAFCNSHAPPPPGGLAIHATMPLVTEPVLLLAR